MAANKLYYPYDGNKSYKNGEYITFAAIVFLCVQDAGVHESPLTQPTKWVAPFASGSGSVTSFSAGSLSQLFVSHVATPTTTPALTFSVTQTPFYFPQITESGTGYQFAGILGSNVLAVKLASTVALTVTYNNGASGVGATITLTAGTLNTMDGVALNDGDTFLYKDALTVNQIQNGVYIRNSSTLATRTTDADTTTELDPEVVIATQGTQKGIPFRQVTDSPVIGTDPIIYENNGDLGKQGWRLNGNSVAVEKWIGTKTNFRFPIRTNNVEHFSIEVGGTIKRDTFSYSIFDDTNANTTWGKNTGIALTTGTNNDFFGKRAGEAVTSGVSNSLFGASNGQVLTTGSNNTFFGTGAGGATTTGSNNVLMGANTGNVNTVGNFLTLIGVGANVNANNLSTIIALGEAAIGTANNQVVYGSAAFYYIEEQHFWSGTGIHGVYYRTTTPEGAQAAQRGSKCYVDDGTVGTELLKVTGTGNTGWGQVVTSISGAAVDLTAQVAAKTATTIYTPAATGMYRISVYLQVTTAASISSVLGGTTGVVISYNDGDGNVAQTDTVALRTTAGAIALNAAGNTTATNLNGDIVIYAKAGVAVQYAIDYTSTGTAMAYSAHLRLEAL